MDRDLERRHRPTGWAVFGEGQAILAGNAMCLLAIDILRQADGPGLRALPCLTGAIHGLISGQSDDLAFENADSVDLAACLRMEAGKTAALLSCSTAIGALLVGAPAAVVDGLAGFGFELGIAFQLVDDVLGIIGDPAVTGKSASSDVRTGKRSAPVVAALRSGTDAGDAAQRAARRRSANERGGRRAGDRVDHRSRRAALDRPRGRPPPDPRSGPPPAGVGSERHGRPDRPSPTTSSTVIADQKGRAPVTSRIRADDAPDATAAMESARDYLLGRQAPGAWWKGELRTNVTMDAEDLLLRSSWASCARTTSEQAARWIRSQQRADGTWANFEAGPGDLSTTVEAYVALRLAGDDLDATHMRTARAWILANGGLEGTRVFTRIWLALFGEWSWDELPTMPPEIVLLPKWVPLNVYDWACWARQTVVPLTVVNSIRPVRPLPFTVAELRVGGVPAERRRAPARSVARAFQLLDKALSWYQRSPVKPGRRLALRTASEWIIARQEADGGWGGIQPPWVYSILALHLLGYPADHPVMMAAINGLEGFLVREPAPDGAVRRLEACQSPCGTPAWP